MRALSIVARAVSPTRAATSTRFAAATIREPYRRVRMRIGGELLARGGKFKILEGPEKFHRFVVIKFASLERAVACHSSPEYQAAAAHRKKDGAGELESSSSSRSRKSSSCWHAGCRRRHAARPETA